MKRAALMAAVVSALGCGSFAATNLVSNTVTVTNRVQGIVTYVMSNGVARVQDPSGRLVGTAEERALKVAAEGQADIASAAADAAGTAMEEWREFTATTDVKVVYIDAGFTQDLPALAPNLCGWVAGSFYDRTNDHYHVWFNREMDAPPSMCARIVSESGTNWLDGAWEDWAVTNWIDTATGREWTRPYSAEVEYLESHGTEWIDTGVFYQNTDGHEPEVSVDVLIVENPGGSARRFLGATDGTRFFQVYYQDKFFGWQPLKDTSRIVSASEVLPWNQRYTATGRVVNGLYSVIRDGVIRGSCDNQQVSRISQSIYLFTANNNGYARSDGPSIRFFSFRFSDGFVSMDLIPVLDLAGRPAMYDRVSGQLFYNQGTGEFAYGPVTNAAPVPCRELVVPRRNANCVLKTGTVITLGGRDGFDADIHKVNVEVGGEPTPTTSTQLPLFYAVTRSGTNTVTRAYTNGFLNVENGFIKEPSNE